jgi:hypothetical protein
LDKWGSILILFGKTLGRKIIFWEKLITLATIKSGRE